MMRRFSIVISAFIIGIIPIECWTAGGINVSSRKYGFLAPSLVSNKIKTGSTYKISRYCNGLMTSAWYISFFLSYASLFRKKRWTMSTDERSAQDSAPSLFSRGIQRLIRGKNSERRQENASAVLPSLEVRIFLYNGFIRSFIIKLLK